MAVGDHVVGSLLRFCGTCAVCRDGRTYQCPNTDATQRNAGEPPRLSRDGQPVTPVFGTAAFAEYTIVHESQLARVPEALPFPQGVGLGCGLGLGGAIGSLLGGQLSDRWSNRNAFIWIPVIGSVLAFPFYAIVLLWPSAGAALIFLIVPVAAKSLWYGPVYAAVQRLNQPRSRATALAIFLFILNAFGLGAGPLLIGLLSDALARTLGSAEGLRWALIILSGVSLLSAACFYAARERSSEPDETFR